MAEEKKNLEAEEAAEDTSVSTETKSEKKEKKKGKSGELEALKKELEAKDDLLKRTAAEFDNFKKRTEREKAGVAEFAKAGIIKKLLPILDNVDRAAAADKESADYIKGVELIIKQFESLASDLGIEEVANVGDSFDPNFHEAVMHIEDENLGENVVSQVLQKGYKIGDTVIRPAMVQVAN